MNGTTKNFDFNAVARLTAVQASKGGAP